MRPEETSQRLFALTRARGKMYEMGIAEASHEWTMGDRHPQELFLLAIATLGDAASFLTTQLESPLPAAVSQELGFAADFLDAFIESRLDSELDPEIRLLAASSYYLAGRPGSSLVLARGARRLPDEGALTALLQATLVARWDDISNVEHPLFKTHLYRIATSLAQHFALGAELTEFNEDLQLLQRTAYAAGSARDLLLVDVIAAIARQRVSASAWHTLPAFTGISAARWSSAISKPEFPKELWPSQVRIGQQGLFSGHSGIVQMPTSAGKTRAVEMILRSSFLSGRSKLAVVVAPFRALSHEISTSLRFAFRGDDVKVNELSDAMQLDYMAAIAALFGADQHTEQFVLVLTPEKLLYVLRQSPELLAQIGLVIYDEGHQFDSGARGITYELLLTEIKTLLPEAAQTILISAVIPNAEAIGEWLIGADCRLVTGAGLVPTARSVAFASWLEDTGQLVFVESPNFQNVEFAIPNVIEQAELAMIGSETKTRLFPQKDKASDMSLYLGLRLCSEGAVAVFCGRKDSVNGLAARVVEIYARGFAESPPEVVSNPLEVARLQRLIAGHFGEASTLSTAAGLGVFIHHGATPHGLRLCIEFAMQKALIKFVACTSTLAQGVNLPIRYLVVSGTRQGGEGIKVRDFQNLIGRAGRSGMHTEGMVIFADTLTYDKKDSWKERWRFREAVQLLSASSAEVVTSSLLELLAPFLSMDKRSHELLPAGQMIDLLMSGEDSWREWAEGVKAARPGDRFDVRDLIAKLKRRFQMISAIESFLMHNRGNEEFDVYQSAVRQLAANTLAFHLASESERAGLLAMFERLAAYVNAEEASVEKQAAYSRTLLGARSAQRVEAWVEHNRAELSALTTNAGWIRVTWPLFQELLDDRCFHSVIPSGVVLQLAEMWLEGRPYEHMFAEAAARGARKRWGELETRVFTDDDIIDVCESSLGYGCSLVVGAISQCLSEPGQAVEATAVLQEFQKALRYGLPNRLAITLYEYGFADRVVAQELAALCVQHGWDTSSIAGLAKSRRQELSELLQGYPSYFTSVLASRS
jgi:POLQ-like helicase